MRIHEIVDQIDPPTKPSMPHHDVMRYGKGLALERQSEELAARLGITPMQARAMIQQREKLQKDLRYRPKWNDDILGSTNS